MDVLEKIKVCIWNLKKFGGAWWTYSVRINLMDFYESACIMKLQGVAETQQSLNEMIKPFEIEIQL